MYSLGKRRKKEVMVNSKCLVSKTGLITPTFIGAERRDLPGNVVSG